jgi:hypothetical protein
MKVTGMPWMAYATAAVHLVKLKGQEQGVVTELQNEIGNASQQEREAPAKMMT